MKKIHLESQRVGRKVELEMRRGKSIHEALAIAAMEAKSRQDRLDKIGKSTPLPKYGLMSYRNDPL
ncbi:MAG: hypothetical protein NUV74_05500 [Candidatus Brocadiaceae bacterium]|nr:hypothetical protein [Candidatus Brocadiaceae bacterium]